MGEREQARKEEKKKTRDQDKRHVERLVSKIERWESPILEAI